MVPVSGSICDGIKPRKMGFAVNMPRVIFRKGQSIRIHSWTEEEDEFLRKNFKHSRASLRAISKELGLGMEVVRQRLYAIGIKKKDKVWSSNEDASLTREYSSMPTPAIARAHNRTERSITARAYKLHLSKIERDGCFTMEEATQILGVDTAWLRRRMNNGHHLEAVPFDPERPPKKGNCAPWCITRKALRDFIRAYPSELSGRDVDLVTIVDLLVGIKTNTYELGTGEV